MESVYRSYSTNASDKLNIKEYFDEFTNLISYKYNKNDKSSVTTVDIPLPQEELEELADKCDISLLNSDGIEVSNDKRRSTAVIFEKDIPTDSNLKTLEKLEEKYSEFDTGIYKPALKYQVEQIVNYDNPIKTEPTAMPGKDILIFIRVYHPFTYGADNGRLKRQKISVCHVIALLGQQTLADLCDHIQCLSNLSLITENSNMPWEYAETRNKNIYKSSFVYIENTFYNDMRDSTNKDNSHVIREWAEKRNFGPFTTAKMEDTQLQSLSVRFGYPWVYQHQGNCEHLIVFSDARLVAADDDLSIANYPRVHRAKPFKFPSCMMCADRSVHWVEFDSDRIPIEPSFHCHKCFMSFNYKKDKKIGNFKAYRYPYDPDIMKLVEKNNIHT